MRHRYFHLDPDLLRSLLADLDLRRLFNQLLMMSSGDVEQVMEWMRQLQQQGHLPSELDLEKFFASLEEDETIQRDPTGAVRLSAVGQRRIRKSAFEEIFTNLKRSGAGYHAVTNSGEGVEQLPETREYRFGDDFNQLDATQSVINSLKRNQGTLSLAAEDLQVRETEHLTASATIVAIDISYSMVFYGEDRLTPAKKVALALTELIHTKYARDHLEVVAFGDDAQAIEIGEIASLEAGPYHTNTKAALELCQGLLARCHQRNKQIFLITDGHPTAFREGNHVYKNPWSLDLKIVNRTLEEADRCRRHKIVITTFMVATDPNLVDFVEKMTKINRGRAYFASPYNLSEFIFADYIRNRRRRVR